MLHVISIFGLYVFLIVIIEASHVGVPGIWISVYTGG